MKKLIGLILLAPFFAFGQLKGVQATTVYGGSAASETYRATLAIGEIYTGTSTNGERATLGIVSFAGNIMATSFPEENFIQFKTFPNPAVSSFQIDSPVNLSKILLFDAQGKLVLKIPGQNTTVNTESLRSGLYQLFVITDKDKLYGLGGIIIAE